jgi:hypothetical protein
MTFEPGFSPNPLRPLACGQRPWRLTVLIVIVLTAYGWTATEVQNAVKLLLALLAVGSAVTGGNRD